MSKSIELALKQMRQAAENLQIEENDHAQPEKHREMIHRAKMLLFTLASAVQHGHHYPTTGRAEEFDFSNRQRAE